MPFTMVLDCSIQTAVDTVSEVILVQFDISETRRLVQTTAAPEIIWLILIFKYYNPAHPTNDFVHVYYTD